MQSQTSYQIKTLTLRNVYLIRPNEFQFLHKSWFWVSLTHLYNSVHTYLNYIYVLKVRNKLHFYFKTILGYLAAKKINCFAFTRQK